MADDELFDFDNGDNLHDYLRNALNNGSMGIDEIAEIIKAEPYDLTTHFHSALYAMEADHLVEYFRKVEIRVGGKTIGLGMEVRSDFEATKASEEDKILIARAIVAVLRAGGLPAVRDGKRVFVHTDDCDGGCGIEHGEIDPFANQVSAFREEMDAALGTDAPPDEGWAQWMGRG